MKSLKKIIKRPLTGALVGSVNGLFGGGGGMIAVPALNSILGYSSKVAHATAIFIIAPVSAAAAITYVINGFFIPKLVIPVSIGNVLGGALGAKLLNELPQNIINILFVIVMFAAGVRMVLP
ncbi:MAG: sulfite exporter TauE/SafE family protein [Clostridia bacterium]|nr:sulfite exporter TauE/SafE family protein [Clostridia bacterium]